MVQINTNSIVLIFALMFFFNPVSLNIKLTAPLFLGNDTQYRIVFDSTNSILLISDIIFLFFFIFN